MKVSWWVGVFGFILSLGTSLTFLFFVSLGDAFLDLDFGLGYEGKLVGGCFRFYFVIGNVINVPFSFFSLGDAFLDLDFGLGYEGKLVGGFFRFVFVIGNVINVPFLCFL